MYYIRQYIHDQVNFFHARQWLGHDGIRAAASAMFHLNKSANDKVYSLKNEFVKKLYEQGYCREVTIQHQDMECYRCGGTGDYYGDGDCWHCDGTGVYRTHILYRFVFDIGGRIYVWHQPQRLVTGHVHTPQMGEGQYTGKRTYVEMERDCREVLCATVHEWLRQNYFIGEITGYKSLSDSLMADFRHIVFLFRTKPQDFISKVSDRIRKSLITVGIVGDDPEYDEEFPF